MDEEIIRGTRPVARIRSVEPLDGFRVRIGFADGVEKEIDLDQYLRGPLFEPIRQDPEYFRSVSVDPISETLTWSNGADIDADVLRYDLTPAWMESETLESR